MNTSTVTPISESPKQPQQRQTAHQNAKQPVSTSMCRVRSFATIVKYAGPSFLRDRSYNKVTQTPALIHRKLPPRPPVTVARA
jgi:hypothetical protein